MRKFITAGMAVAMLALPAVASADQPDNPGCFGKTRSANIHTYYQGEAREIYGTWGQTASQRAGTNGELNQEWREANCS